MLSVTIYSYRRHDYLDSSDTRHYSLRPREYDIRMGHSAATGAPIGISSTTTETEVVGQIRATREGRLDAGDANGGEAVWIDGAGYSLGEAVTIARDGILPGITFEEASRGQD